MLFIGCGFGGDPDVEYLLTENALRHPGAYPHYALVSDQGDEKAFDKAKREGLNIKFIQFPVPLTVDGKKDYSAFSAALADLKEQVLEARQSSV